MESDLDRIRVDLIKVKRKLFLSYPKGSPEQKQFLLTSKISELDYLSRVIPDDVANYVFHEHMSVMKLEFIHTGLNIIFGVVGSFIMYSLSVSYPKSFPSLLWPVMLILGLTNAARHLNHLLTQQNKIKPFQAEYNSLQTQIKKIREELEKLR